jgi:hypothetical protein
VINATGIFFQNMNQKSNAFLAFLIYLRTDISDFSVENCLATTLVSLSVKYHRYIYLENETLSKCIPCITQMRIAIQDIGAENCCAQWNIGKVPGSWNGWPTQAKLCPPCIPKGTAVEIQQRWRRGVLKVRPTDSRRERNRV